MKKQRGSWSPASLEEFENLKIKQPKRKVSFRISPYKINVIRVLLIYSPTCSIEEMADTINKDEEIIQRTVDEMAEDKLVKVVDGVISKYKYLYCTN